MQSGRIVTPGDRLGTIRQISSGAGTYTKGLHVYASIVGTLELATTTTPPSSSSSSTPTSSSSSSSIIANVIPPKGKKIGSSQVLKVDDIILGKVSRISLQQALVDIVATTTVGPLREMHEGAIRKEDVRKGGTEDVTMGDCFRPGDVVAARVISLGDSRKYFLSTAESELGVVRGRSRNGEVMLPVSWKEMECVGSKTRENRKCAKPKAVKKSPQNEIKK